MDSYHFSISPKFLDGAELDHFLGLGWFRMHQTIFTSNEVSSLDAIRVHWLRMPLAEITNHRRHRKIRNANKSFRATIETFTKIRDDHEELFARYRASITFGAETIHDCLFDDTEENIFQTHCISVYDGEKLIAGGYFDTGVTSAAAILNFFDPEYSRYGLGKFLMLVAVDYLKEHGYTFYYPGYLLAGNNKMDYKLFLGKEATQYYDPETRTWKPYHEGLHLPELVDGQVNELELAEKILEDLKRRIERFTSDGSDIHQVKHNDH